MKIKSKFARDTGVMTAAALLTQTAQVSFNLWLTSKIGAANMGLFGLVTAVFSMAITFSCAGTRLASSRITAEISARGNSTAASFRVLCRYALIISISVSAAMLFGAPLTAKKWIGSPAVIPALRLLALSLPVIAVNCVMNGRFTALGFASQYSAILLGEELFRIAAAAIMIKSGAFNGDPMAAIAAGKVFSEIFSLSLALLLGCFAAKREKGLKREKVHTRYLLRIALPDLFGSSARSILLTVEHLLIPRSLRAFGAGNDSALAAYGLIHSIALPILLWPAALLRSCAELIIPETAKKNALGKSHAINSGTERLLHLTMLFAMGSAMIMFIYAKPITSAAGTAQAWGYVRLLAPLVPVMFCDMTVDALLRGLDCQVTSMIINIADSAICVILVAALLPVQGVKGYIFILYISEIINFYFSIRKLCKVTVIEISVKNSVVFPLVKAFFCCAPFMTNAEMLCRSKVSTVICVTFSAAAYVVLCVFPRKRKAPEAPQRGAGTGE